MTATPPDPNEGSSTGPMGPPTGAPQPPAAGSPVGPHKDPPGSGGPVRPVPGPPVRTLVPVAGLTTALSALLAVALATQVLSAAPIVWRIIVVDQLASGQVDLGTVTLVDNLVTWTSVFAMLATVAAAAVFIGWMFRVRSNAEVLSPRTHERSTAWIVLGWVVPVVNIWFPFTIMRDILRASDPETRHDTRPTGRLHATLVLWWLLFLVWNFGNRVIYVQARSAATADAIKSLDTAGVALTAVGVVAAYLAIRVVRGIKSFQDAV